MYRLKEFVNKKGEPTYQIQKKILGIWFALYFEFSVNNKVYVSIFSNIGGFNNKDFSKKEGAENFFNGAVWFKARQIIKARKIKKARKEGKVTYHKFP